MKLDKPLKILAYIGMDEFGLGLTWLCGWDGLTCEWGNEGPELDDCEECPRNPMSQGFLIPGTCKKQSPGGGEGKK